MAPSTTVFFLLALTQPFLNRIQHVNPFWNCCNKHYGTSLGKKKIFKLEAIFNVAILRFPISPPEPCILVIFKLINFIFWNLIENYITANDTSGFFDKLSISSEIELELGPSRIKGLFIKFHHTLNWVWSWNQKKKKKIRAKKN
jgi:hypothetical protein